jgi:hypothetical protein
MWRSTAHRLSATSSPSELPRAKNDTNWSARTSATRAITPATGPASRAATRKASAMAMRPPARATTSHSSGAASSPNSENGAVNSTGSGFQDGPAVVTRSRWAICRPQISQAHGS